MADKQIVRVTTPLLGDGTGGTTTLDIIGGQAESFSAVSGGVLYVPAGLVVTVEITHDVIDPTAATPVWLNSVTVTGSDEHVISSPCTALRITRVSGSGVVRGELLLGAAGAAGTTDNPSVVQGPAASSAPTSGNPVLVGADVHSSPRSFDNADVASLGATLAGLLEITLGDLLFGEDPRGRMKVEEQFTSTRITTATTTPCLVGDGTIGGIFISVALVNTVSIYDHPSAASGTLIAVLRAGTPVGYHKLPRKCALGCTVVTAGADEIVVFTA